MFAVNIHKKLCDKLSICITGSKSCINGNNAIKNTTYTKKITNYTYKNH